MEQRNSSYECCIIITSCIILLLIVSGAIALGIILSGEEYDVEKYQVKLSFGDDEYKATNYDVVNR